MCSFFLGVCAQKLTEIEHLPSPNLTTTTCSCMHASAFILNAVQLDLWLLAHLAWHVVGRQLGAEASNNNKNRCSLTTCTHVIELALQPWHGRCMGSSRLLVLFRFAAHENSAVHMRVTDDGCMTDDQCMMSRHAITDVRHTPARSVAHRSCIHDFGRVRVDFDVCRHD